MALLEVNGLKVYFHTRNGLVKAVDDVSFNVDAGETLAIVGESGSGKSVTCYSLLDLLPKPPAAIEAGTALFNGEDLLTCDSARMRQIRGSDIAVIFQDPMTSLNPFISIGEQLIEPLIYHRDKTRVKDRKTARRLALELLDEVGIIDPESRFDSYPHEFSGGMRQRVMIAMALANEPELLIADEPTTALDVTVQLKILELLRELQQKLGMALLLISHDLNLVRKIAHRVCVMYRGNVVEENDCATLFSSPQHEYTRQLLAADPRGEPVPVDPDAPEILRTEQLRVWFPIRKGVLRRTVDHVKAVTDISFSLPRGQTLGIVGESGSGKTTLGMALLRLIDSQGLIECDGTRLDGLSQQQVRPLRREFQVVFQDPYGSLSPRMSVGQIISEGLEIHRIGTEAEREQMVIQALEEVGLDPETRHRYPHEFSGGQRQRISIARALVLKPKLILLDEPTSALDRTVQGQVVELLRSLQQKYNLTYLFISHDLAVVKVLSHQLMVIRQGEVVEQGPAGEIFASPQHDYTRQLLEAAFALPQTDNRADTAMH